MAITVRLPRWTLAARWLTEHSTAATLGEGSQSGAMVRLSAGTDEMSGRRGLRLRHHPHRKKDSMSVSRRVITVVGAHAEGEIGDVITGGVLPPPGATMMEKKLAFARQLDHVRRLLIQEPRGSVARHVNLLVPSTREDCAAGAIIMEPTEYVPMSGSNTICVATVLLETGMVPMHEPETRLKLDMPGGVIEVRAECRDGRCLSITFRNAPAFVDRLDANIEVEGLGTLKVDIAYGGMFYAI